MKALLITICLIPFLSCQSKGNGESSRDIKNGFIEVPENRVDPESRMIEIHYALIPSKNESDRPPIVFLQGGPGGSSLAMVPFFRNNPLNDNHDIIVFDARGTGRSTAYCQDLGNDFLQVMADDLTTEEEIREALRISESCKEELNANQVDLAGYSSNDLAADVEALRVELGIKKWILFGGSYGSRLGLTYLRNYDHAEAAVFMAMFPLEVNMYDDFTKGLDGSLTYLFNNCQNDPDCNQKYPELRKTFINVIAELRTAPKTFSYKGEPFVMNAQDALLLTHQMLYRRATIAGVPRFIYSLKNGDIDVVAQAINRTAQTMSYINAATYWSIQAREENQFNKKNAIASSLEEYEYLQPGPAILSSDQLIMEQWHKYRSEQVETEPVNVETPILIANGLYDPITPISNAEGVIEYLPNATLVGFPNDGHTTFNPCFFDLFEQFVASGYQAVDGSCASEGSIEWR